MEPHSGRLVTAQFSSFNKLDINKLREREPISISQRITVLHQGRVIADGAPDEVRRDPEVRRVYLGEKRA